ncbi:MAG: RagB/SusD family nutrient uptake outer membrane protein [Saprospiraceae bacterium]|nr:RagB/SusD family nutrient uptake outer membrane protein [Saprospiraceae bacterium]
MKQMFAFSPKIILTLALAMGTVAGCKKEFLDRKPLGELTYDTFFATEAQAIQATNAVYNQFRSWECVGLGYLGVTDILSDDADKGSTPNDQPLLADIDNFNFDAANTYFSQVWTGYYRAIARANIAIKRIPDVPNMNETLRKRLIGECKFLRAYSYFLLMQWFGDLPIITEPLSAEDYYNQSRRPVGEVQALIERDLLDAIEALPNKSGYEPKDLGRATKGAAQGILAKLYLLKKDFPKAEQYSLDLINSMQYSLLSRYSDNFLPIGENGAESVFEITAAALQPDAGGVVGPGATPYNMIQGVRGNPNLGWGFNRPSDNLVSFYENGDPRRDATVIYVGEVLPDGVTVVQPNPEILVPRFNQKAWVPPHPGLQDNGPGNIRILRYADVLLVAAEALNENNKPAEALIFLNQVRKRARGTSQVVLPDVTVTDQALLRERIYRERRAELAMEQHRWFDLLRWGRAEQVMQAVGKNFVAPKHWLLPIPQSEVDLTDGSIRQNPGY